MGENPYKENVHGFVKKETCGDCLLIIAKISSLRGVFRVEYEPVFLAGKYVYREWFILGSKKFLPTALVRRDFIGLRLCADYLKHSYNLLESVRTNEYNISGV